MTFKSLAAVIGLTLAGPTTANEIEFDNVQLQQQLSTALHYEVTNINDINVEIARKTAREIESLNLQLTLAELISRNHQDLGILAGGVKIAE